MHKELVLLMKKVTINPLTIWVRWLLRTLILEYRYRKSHLKIGYLSTVLNCKFGKYNTIYKNVYLSDVELGDFTYIANNTTMSKARVGKFCSIGHNVFCGPGNHPSHTFVSTHPVFYSSLKQTQTTFADKNYYQESEAITIGNDVWIGADSIILNGVKIADGAIIAAGAVVTKNVAPYAIVGGVPAKLIRKRFHEDEIELLLKLKWWDKETDWLRENYKLFHDISSLIKSPLCDSGHSSKEC